MLQQLSIFDIETDVVPFEIGDTVNVINQVKADEDPESFYYLKDFENKKGVVTEVIEEPHLQYRVRFGERYGYFYHEELNKTM